MTMSSAGQSVPLQNTDGEIFRLLLENMQDVALIMLDRTRRVCRWNAGAERLFGYGASEIGGQPLSVLFPGEVETAGHLELRVDGATARERTERDTWMVRKDGSRFWARSLTTPLWDENHSLRGFVTVIRDRTALREADKRVQAESERHPQRNK